MTAYAVAHLRNVRMGSGIVAYLEAIDATLAPFGGHYIIHGGKPAVLEGNWQGDLVVLAFPDRRSAEDWYASEAYRRIQHFRTDNADGELIIVDGVDRGHRGADILSGLVAG
jgi:uncharacterized protein (DUF1330 family)